MIVKAAVWAMVIWMLFLCYEALRDGLIYSRADAGDRQSYISRRSQPWAFWGLWGFYMAVAVMGIVAGLTL
ncbi:MAG: hypothetical protein ACQES2_06570 [Pseudomonadota bacterium]